ncbi:MAG: hypothetical protein HY964_10390 [Ignavibacteriales bacterium]|nr:hypothetical protein [Ignavibacteriales bacterium]
MIKKIRAILVTLLLVFGANLLISYASTVPLLPDSPRPKSTVPLLPDSPRPKSTVPLLPDSPRPKSTVPLLPDSPRP